MQARGLRIRRGEDKLRKTILLGIVVFLLALVLSNAFPEWCYQESANVSTACGGLNTGNYSCSGNWLVDCNNIFDGDWSTWSFGDGAYLHINYTKPSNALSSSLLQYKDEDIETNYSSPSGCWDYDSNKLVFRLEDRWVDVYTNLTCYDGTDWVTIRRASPTGIHEEAMWWNMTGSPPIFTTPLYNDSTTDTSTDIKWVTNENANYTLRYTTNPDYTDGTLISNDDFGISRTQSLTSLSGSTNYYINVSVWDASGNLNISNMSFRTAKTIFPHNLQIKDSHLKVKDGHLKIKN